MPWSGWPAEWETPGWFGEQPDLTDIAWTCVDLNASLLAAMPPYLVYSPSSDMSRPAAWLTNPDPDLYASYDEFAKQLFWDYQLGEVFLLATSYYADEYPARFHVLPPWAVEVDFDDMGLRRYKVGGDDVTPDVLHIRYQSTTGDARGHGPLEAGGARLLSARMLARYAHGLAAQGGIPSSLLIHPDELTDEQADWLKQQWLEARMRGPGEPAVVSGGLQWVPTQINPREMGLLELEQFSESRIAIMLGVPPFLVGLPTGGDSMTYSNVTALFDYHWRAGLRPKASAVMAALSNWLLPAGTSIEMNRDAYVQPGPLERAQTWNILVAMGAMTVEQVQEVEKLDAMISAAGPVF
jgi:HK97 family phage portal protein